MKKIVIFKSLILIRADAETIVDREASTEM